MNEPEILTALSSGRADQVSGALYDLSVLLASASEVSIPMPPADVLATYDHRLAERIVLLYLDVVRHFNAFTPTATWRDAVGQSVDAVLRHPSDVVVERFADLLRSDLDPESAVGEALEHVGLRGAHSVDEAAAVGRLVSRLLGDGRLRPAVIDALARWSRYESVYPILEPVIPELRPVERERVAERSTPPTED
jgi:hypothetical protein